MSFKSFKNRRSARKHLPRILPSLIAVDKQLKPCYLWDVFTANLFEIQDYLNDLHKIRLTQCQLKAFPINETIFVTEYKNLENYLDSTSAENVTIVDVSANLSTPTILPIAEKQIIFDTLLKTAHSILSELQNPSENLVKDIQVDISLCNVTALFGTLLGYPVLYWYTAQSPDSDFKCLSMVPLTIYQVLLSQGNNNLCDHELFSFSIPQQVYIQTECFIQNWFDALSTKSKNYELGDLALKQRIVILPSVSM